MERLAREALADVRQTVGAYREVTLAGELAGARSALAAAGIAAELPADVPELPRGRGTELFGWAVREGVTNVVRHSGARRCTIRVRPGRGGGGRRRPGACPIPTPAGTGWSACGSGRGGSTPW